VRYLILTDVHGNSEALAAVLLAVADQDLDQVLLLGDLVGYGGGPNEVVEAVRKLDRPTTVIRGNHDKVVAEIEDGAGFNRVALAAVRWTTSVLAPENLEYVRSLPVGPLEVRPGLSICHGSPLDEDEYLLSTDQAQRAFARHPSSLTFFGHTHIPSLFSGSAEGVEVRILEHGDPPIEIRPGVQYLINPGSVGQPRDRDPRAAYMIYDARAQRVEAFRIEYPLADAQQRILDAGLPPVLAQRLAVGI
jgi:predicted phosphodiesterase